MDCLVPPFLWRPRSSHVLYRSHQKAGSTYAELWDLMGAASCRQAPPNQRGLDASQASLGKTHTGRWDQDRQGAQTQAGIMGASKSFLVPSAPF